MGAVDTTYTFTATDTITSAKMNNIIGQTTITADAIIGTTLEVASGKLKIRSAGITSNEMGANSVVAAAITDSNVTTSKIADANVTQAKLASNVVGNGPAFKVGGDATAVNVNTTSKLTLTTEIFDTNNNFSNSRFTPTIAGYYLFNGVAQGQSRSLYALNCYIFKNGLHAAFGSVPDSLSYISTASAILYLNGTGDYVELYTTHSTAGTHGVIGYLDGCLIRSA